MFGFFSSPYSPFLRRVKDTVSLVCVFGFLALFPVRLKFAVFILRTLVFHVDTLPLYYLHTASFKESSYLAIIYPRCQVYLFYLEKIKWDLLMQ